MSTLQLHLPDRLKAYLDRRVPASGCGSAEAYVERLIEADRARESAEDVERELLQSVDGPFTDWTDSDVQDIRAAGQALIARRSGTGK